MKIDSKYLYRVLFYENWACKLFNFFVIAVVEHVWKVFIFHSQVLNVIERIFVTALYIKFIYNVLKFMKINCYACNHHKIVNCASVNNLWLFELSMTSFNDETFNECRWSMKIHRKSEKLHAWDLIHSMHQRISLI